MAGLVIVLASVASVWWLQHSQKSVAPFGDAEYRAMLVEATTKAGTGDCDGAMPLFARLETETTSDAYTRAEMQYRYAECLAGRKDYQSALRYLEQARTGFESINEGKRVIQVRQLYDTTLAQSLNGGGQ